MKKSIKNKLNLFLLLFVIAVAVYSIFYNYAKYSPTQWLKYFPDTSDLDMISHFSFWWYIMTSDIFGGFMYIIPIIIIMISISSFFKIYHSGYFTNIVIKSGYKKMLLLEIIKSWRYSLIIPLISIIVFNISVFLYPNNHIYTYSEVNYLFQIVNENMFVVSPVGFILLHFLLAVVMSIIFINIGLVVSRFIKKFSLSVVVAFILILFIENFNNLLIAPIVAKLTGIERMYNAFSIYNIYYLDSLPSLIWEIIFALLLFLISILSLYLVYKDYEKVYFDYE